MFVRWILRVLLVTAVVLTAAWGALALWYQVHGGAVARWIACVAWIAFTLTLIGVGWSRRSFLPFGIYALAFLTLLAWWSTIAPSNHRDWADDVSRSVTGSVDGDVVT